MLSKVVLVLAFASLVVAAARYFGVDDDLAVLEREAAGQLDALREHLFRR
jgi:hypothetical protein